MRPKAPEAMDSCADIIDIYVPNIAQMLCSQVSREFDIDSEGKNCEITKNISWDDDTFNIDGEKDYWTSEASNETVLLGETNSRVETDSSATTTTPSITTFTESPACINFDHYSLKDIPLCFIRC